MQKKRRQVILEKLNLTKPQRENVLQLMAAQKNKYRKLLHEAHERMHIITDLTTSLEFWLNVDGRFEHISPACEKITGYAPAEFLEGRVTMEEVIHPDSRRRFRMDRKRAMTGKTGSDVEYKFIRKDAVERWAIASWQPVITRRGRQIGVRISIQDATRLKEAENARDCARAALDSFACDCGKAAVLYIDARGAVTGWSASAQALFQRDMPKHNGIVCADLIVDAASLDFAAVAAEKKRVPVTFVRGDGTEGAALLAVFPCLDGIDKQGGYCLFLTATERGDS
ncbi:MAG: PAS domain-containing protein [Ignavibacteriae bacterium]|nr:PAS domain-containing protein [Ignavibacteriota bacterium]